MTNLLQLAFVANRTGGFTYDPQKDTLREEGFAVSIFKNKEMIVDSPVLSGHDIYRFVDSAAQELLVPGACVGAWKNDGKWYLDVSVVMPTFYGAMELAKSNNQLAIFDLDTKETIYTKEA
jgi:hypothetical protein